MEYNPFDDDVLTQPMLDAIKAHQVTGAEKRLHSLAISVFIGLPEREAKEWPLQYCHTLKGKDTGQVVDHFMIWLLADEQHGVLRFCQKNQTIKAIKRVADLYTRRIAGKEPSAKEWEQAAAEAWAAEAWAAAAAEARAARAARAWAAEAAARAAEAARVEATAEAARAWAEAARAAALEARAWARQEKYYVAMRNKLIELIEAAPMHHEVA